jgi:hypothetical protein
MINRISLSTKQLHKQQQLKNYINYIDSVIDGQYKFSEAEINLASAFDTNQDQKLDLQELTNYKSKLIEISDRETLSKLIDRNGVSQKNLSPSELENSKLIEKISSTPQNTLTNSLGEQGQAVFLTAGGFKIQTDINQGGKQLQVIDPEGQVLSQTDVVNASYILDDGTEIFIQADKLPETSAFYDSNKQQVGARTLYIRSANGKQIMQTGFKINDPDEVAKLANESPVDENTKNEFLNFSADFLRDFHESATDNGKITAGEFLRLKSKYGKQSDLAQQIYQQSGEIYNAKSFEKYLLEAMKSINVAVSDEVQQDVTTSIKNVSLENQLQDEIKIIESPSLEVWESIARTEESEVKVFAQAKGSDSGWLTFDPTSKQFKDQQGAAQPISRAATISSLSGIDALKFAEFSEKSNIDTVLEDQYLELLTTKKGHPSLSSFLNIARAQQINKIEDKESLKFFVNNYDNLSESERAMFSTFLKVDKSGNYAKSMINFINQDLEESKFIALKTMHKQNLKLDQALNGEEFSSPNPELIKIAGNPHANTMAKKVNLALVANHHKIQENPELGELVNFVLTETNKLLTNDGLNDSEKKRATRFLLEYTEELAKSGTITETMFNANYNHSRIMFNNLIDDNPDIEKTIYNIIDHQEYILDNSTSNLDQQRLAQARIDLNMVNDWQTILNKKEILAAGYDTKSIKELESGLNSKELAMYGELLLLNPMIEADPEHPQREKFLEYIYDQRNPDLIRSFNNILADGADSGTLENFERIITSRHSFQNEDMIDAEFINKYAKLINVSHVIEIEPAFSSAKGRLDPLHKILLENKDLLDDPAIYQFYEEQVQRLHDLLVGDYDIENKAFISNIIISDLAKALKSEGKSYSSGLDHVVDSRYSKLYLKSSGLDQTSEKTWLLAEYKKGQFDSLQALINLERAKPNPDPDLITSYYADMARIDSFQNAMRNL